MIWDGVGKLFILYSLIHCPKNFTNHKKDIKDLTPVRGQDGKISDTQGKDFWSNEAVPSWRPIEIFPAGV